MAEHTDAPLLSNTLENIWQNFLNGNNDNDAKLHWMQLFLFHVQFIEDNVLKTKPFNSFFQPIPEEICSFLLEQVYEIISKSELYAPAQYDTSNTETLDAEQLSANRKHSNLTKLLQKTHNFAQLILSAPSDCSKIVALRNFLTDELGQHLLRFLLKVDIKLVASQKSLCNLCINLFPNCPWSNEIVKLPAPASIFEFIGNLNLHQPSRTKQTLYAAATNTKLQKANAEVSRPFHKHATIEESFEHFKNVKITSDEVAYVLVELLTKYVSNECETTLNEQSITVIALNFALDCLRQTDAATYRVPENAIIIKCAFLQLIERCFNNIFANEENINAIQFQCIFAKLSAALDSNDLKAVELEAESSPKALDIITAESNRTRLLCAINYMIFSVLYNLISVCSSTPHSGSGKPNLYTFKFIDEAVIDVSVESLKHMLLQFHSNSESHSDVAAEVRALIATIFKTIIKIVDKLYRYDQAAGIGGTSGNGAQQKPRRRRCNRRQLHCRTQTPTLSCFFQGILLSLLPMMSTDVQEYAMRYLLCTGTCCCHYTLTTYATCLNVADKLSSNHQKCTYKFIYRKILNTIFVRDDVAMSKRQQCQCTKCDSKLKSLEFHSGILQLYRNQYKKLQTLNFDGIDGINPKALSVLLKHLKHISHALPNDVAAGILAEIVLPIFRQFKALSMGHIGRPITPSKTKERNDFWSSGRKTRYDSAYKPASTPSTPSSPKPPALDPTTEVQKTPPRPRLHLHINSQSTPESDREAHYLKTLHECLNIFVMYLSVDIRLIKAFYNEENIRHFEELLVEPELMRGICDLIKIGIDNITFLGDNSQEQAALSRRLITLQLNSSDCAAHMFNALLSRLAKGAKLTPDSFWLDEDVQCTEHNATYASLSPVDILHITALQWSLNHELLKTSQIFYNEFAKIYSIVVDDKEVPAEEEQIALKSEPKDSSINYLKDGDKTIIDILKLNYNALSSFLLLPHKNSTDTIKSEEPRHQQQLQQHLYTFAPTSPTSSSADKAIDCFSSSLESLLSSIDPSAPQSLVSVSTSSTVPAVTYDSDVAFDGDGYNGYVDALNETFLQKLQKTQRQQQPQQQQQQQLPTAESAQTTSTELAAQLLTESIVLFDIRHQAHANPAQNVFSSATSSQTPTTTVGGASTVGLSCTSDTLSSVLADPETHVGVVASNVGIIGKLFSMFGAFFGSSRSNSVNDLSESAKQGSENKIDPDLLCFYEANGDCKKYLLKLFETTMAICLKGYQNEEVEKMQKHLRKLKAVILSNAAANWQQHSEEQSRENAVIKALQTLLKIAELSNGLNEPAGVVTGGSIMTATTDEATAASPLRPHARSFNSAGARPHGVGSYHSALPAAKSALTTPTTPNEPPRPISGESCDADYFSTRASLICPDSEMELSENDNEDYYMTADEGYEADGEIPEISDSEVELKTADLWNSFQPTSRYRTQVVHDGLSRLVVEILIELSEMCTKNPVGWTENLAQLANRLFNIRDCIGGALFLLRGFAPVLKCNDARLRELQQSILELIVDLNTPDVLNTFFSILASKNPPMDILIKYMYYICGNSLRKAQPTVELEFPVVIDGKCISTSDTHITEQIDRVRNYHLHAQANTPFNRAPCIIPITHARLWQNDGLTLSLWLQMKSSPNHKSCSQLTEEDTRNSSDEFLTHIASIGTNQAMLSIYLNSNMNLVFEICKPNAEIQTRSFAAPPPPPPAPTTTVPTQPPDDTAEAANNNVGRNVLNTNPPVTTPSSSTPTASTVASPLRNALKQTKLVLLNSFSNMNLFNGQADGQPYYEYSSFDLKHFRLLKNKWTHLAFALDMQTNHLDVTVQIDGLEQHSVILPFRNLRNLTRTHVFQMILVGDGAPAKPSNNVNNYTESRSTLDGFPMRLAISNVLLFNRKIVTREVMLNLTAMGPDFVELTQFQVGNWKPNYGYLNLSRMHSANFGNSTESLKLLKESCIMAYSAQQPDLVMGYDTNIELENISYGHPYGLILYGELMQNQLQSLQTATMLCGGLSALLYLFARVVEVNSNSDSQAMALDLLLSVALSESQLYAEFWRSNYVGLIGYVIKADRCTKDVNLLKSIVNNACSQPLISRRGEALHVNENTTASVVYPRLIVSVLHRYSDWHRSGAEHSEVLDMVFLCILALTREKHPHRDFNMDQLNKASLLNELLNLCKVYVVESPNPVYISKNAAESFINILAVFAGSPPSPSLMDEIMKLALLLHKPSDCYITHDRSKFYFLLTAQPPTKEKSSASTNLSRVAAPFKRNFKRDRPGIAVPTTSPSAPADANRAERINRLRNLHANNSPYKRPLHEFEENLENVADCTKLNKNALRLLSPVEVAQWRSKFRRRSSWNTPANPRNNSTCGKLQKSAASMSLSNLTSPQSISHKRLRLHSATCARSLVLLDGESRANRADRSSQNSLHSLAASLAALEYVGKEGSALNDVFGVTASQRRNKSLVKTDFYNSLGIITLQEGLFRLLKNFLRLLPDNSVEEVLQHYVKVEFLLVLANHSSCPVRTAIIKLLEALTQRLPPNDIVGHMRNFYPQHLANQLTIYPTDAHMFEACLEWVSGVYGNLDTSLKCDKLRVCHRFGLNALLAIVTKTLSDQTEFLEKAFRMLKKMFENETEQQTLIEAGLLQCCAKALHSLYVKSTVVYLAAEAAILDLLTSIGERSLKSNGHINIVWDILNILTFYQEHQPVSVTKNFRSVQAQLQLNWIAMFFGQTNVPWNFKVIVLPDSTLTSAETKTRLELLIDRCVQFFTVFDANHKPSANEIKLFQFLVSYGIATNQRCNNFIAWGLQPSRPRELRAFIIDALWISCQDDFQPSIICDGKMIKSFLWLCLLEDLAQPLENLERLCKHLGINENDSTWNLENELERVELNRSTISAKQKSMLEKTVYKFEPLALSCIESSMVTTRRVAELQNAERKLLMRHMKDYDETCAYTKWMEIVRGLTHEGAPWYCKERSENYWELDDTEGPSRVHTRLRRCHLDIDKRFFMEDYRNQASTDTDAFSSTHWRNDDYIRPLDYLFSGYDQQLNISLNSQILYNFPAKYLPVDGEIDGEIVITDRKLYFMATYRCKYFYVSCDVASITEIWLKRYQHQEKAFEIFLDTNQSLFFSLQNQDDWKLMRDIFCDKIVAPPDQSKVLIITQQWREGLLTNWEYLMTLNQFAGRTYNDLMQYPVFPWILANYTANVLDLTDAQNFRKLEKPIAVQHEENESHYISNYTYINSTMPNMGSLILKPYHYSSHYSNSGTVLHFLVRVPPFTSYFLRYQDNNFDLPDRTFHALSTTWSLASRDSPTDVKELIPEFFCLPEMFENFERFNFGCRQNGDRVEDVQLPPWCLRDTRLFVLIHRQALESELVRNNLHQWIDLIFGHKQSGESAVEAINVFHPATYATFLESAIADPIERKAVETMVKTYGQMPRQLFKSAHPHSKPLNYCLGGKEILSSVRGLRWGVYLGSPQLPTPTLGNIYKLPGAEYLVSFSNTNVVYGLPLRACVMQGAEVDTFNVITWGYDDRIVRIQPLNKMYTKPKNLLHNSSFDDITACGSDSNSNQLWFGHKSGRISIYKCASAEANTRTVKSRQSYMRGLRLSYNSAFRKIVTHVGGKPDEDGEGESTPAAMSTSSISATDVPQRDSANLSWMGPTVLVRHTDEITSIRLSVEFKIAVSAGRDGIAVIWDLNNWSYVRTIERPAEIHHSPITLIAISPTLGDIVTVHTIPQSQNSSNPPTNSSVDERTASPPTADECFEVTEENLDDFVNVFINPNGKSILRLHTVNARYVQHIVHEDRILAACYSYIKEGVGVNVIATAVEGGVVRLWSSWNLSFVSEIVTGISNIKSITYSSHQHLVVLTKDSHIQVWETEGLYGNSPKFPQIAYN